MSNALRATQKGYQSQLDQADRNIENHEKAIETLKKQKADFQAAKKVVDEAVAQLPPEPKAATPARPQKSAPASK